MGEFYQQKPDEILSFFHSRLSGLTQSEVDEKLKRDGYNLLKEKKRKSAVLLLLNQFTSFLVLILVGATVISFLLGETIDAIVIGIIVLLNGLFGFIQEYKAERAIEALKKLGSLKAKVIRNSTLYEIDASLVVVGDILVLEEGDKISGDARLLEAYTLSVDESLLTGESVPVSKHVDVLTGTLTVSEQKNMVFSNTIVTRGKGKAVVVRTGMTTEVGKIAELIQVEKEEMTPLQKKLQSFGKFLGILFLAMCLIVFIVGVLEGTLWVTMFLIAVSLAVAAIPEGLPAIVTICLALGVQRMVKRNVLIRKLSSVETLGSTDVVCADKTGTLTCNEMTVEQLYFDHTVINVSGKGYGTTGTFSANGKSYNPKYLDTFLRICASCNDASIERGDPTERALMVLAAKGGIRTKDDRVGEIPFNSESKYMLTKHVIDKKNFSFIKGAPEIVITMCDSLYSRTRVIKFTPALKRDILTINEGMASKALRVLGIAYSTGGKTIFLGLVGMIDPPRLEVKDAIVRCKEAGIRTIMITGDHKLTALAVAREIGIEGEVLTGKELDDLSESDFLRRVEKTGVYARVTPTHKAKILEGLKKQRHVVAMTGDGVNDAPALKKADIGIAMGVKGTDVAKEASEMVLLDDNFVSIVNAVEEGRGIYDNITKFVDYLLSSNFGEVLVVFLAMLIGFSVDGTRVLPLIAIQLLWMNLVTDGLPAIALGVDPVNPDVMKRKPRALDEPIVTKSMLYGIIFIGFLIAGATLFLFNRFLPELVLAQTVALTTLIVLQVVRVHMVRRHYHESLFSNRWLTLALASSLGLHLLILYTPLNQIFHIVPLGLVEWAWILGVTLVVFMVGTVGDTWIRRITVKESKVL